MRRLPLACRHFFDFFVSTCTATAQYLSLDTSIVICEASDRWLARFDKSHKSSDSSVKRTQKALNDGGFASFRATAGGQYVRHANLRVRSRYARVCRFGLRCADFLHRKRADELGLRRRLCAKGKRSALEIAFPSLIVCVQSAIKMGAAARVPLGENRPSTAIPDHIRERAQK